MVICYLGVLKRPSPIPRPLRASAVGLFLNKLRTGSVLLESFILYPTNGTFSVFLSWFLIPPPSLSGFLFSSLTYACLLHPSRLRSTTQAQSLIQKNTFSPPPIGIIPLSFARSCMFDSLHGSFPPPLCLVV